MDAAPAPIGGGGAATIAAAELPPRLHWPETWGVRADPPREGNAAGPGTLGAAGAATSSAGWL